MVYIVVGVMLLLAAIALIYIISQVEKKRLTSIKQTIRDSNKSSLEEVLEWYPEEMHQEVTNMWEEVRAGK